MADTDVRKRAEHLVGGLVAYWPWAGKLTVDLIIRMSQAAAVVTDESSYKRFLQVVYDSLDACGIATLEYITVIICQSVVRGKWTEETLIYLVRGKDGMPHISKCRPADVVGLDLVGGTWTAVSGTAVDGVWRRETMQLGEMNALPEPHTLAVLDRTDLVAALLLLKREP